MQDLGYCDRIIFLAAGGRLAFHGTIPEALAYFGVEKLEEVYERLAVEETPAEWARRFDAHRGGRLSDVAAGLSAGCRSILVTTGKHLAPPIESAEDTSNLVNADHVCADLPAAARWILNSK